MFDNLMVAPPIDHQRNRDWPCTVTVPLFSLYQSFEQLLQPLVLLPSCVPACMLMSVID